MAKPFGIKQPDAYILQLREGFRNHEIQNSLKGLGWGQFLDNHTPQTGLYGTAAALIAFKAGGAAPDVRTDNAQRSLLDVWNRRDQVHGISDNLNQNVRLAWVLLSVAKGTNLSLPEVKQMLAELLQRQLGVDGLWTDAIDPVPAMQDGSEYATSIVIILLKLLDRFSVDNPWELRMVRSACGHAARSLQKRYLDDPTKPRIYKLPMLVAIALHQQGKVDPAVRRGLKELLYEGVDLSARYVHFFDQKLGTGDYVRDYFILPLALVSPLLMHQDRVSSLYHVFGMRALSELADALDHSELYRVGVARPSALEQGFAAIALEAANLNRPSWIRRTFQRVRYQSTRDLENERRAALFLALVLYLPMGLVAYGAELADAVHGLLPDSIINGLRATRTTPGWVLPVMLVTAGVIGEPKEVLKAIFRRRR